HRQPGIHPTPVTEADLRSAVQRLSQVDTQHRRQIERHGAGYALPPNIAEFVLEGEELIEQLRSLVKNPANTRWTARWLSVIRKEDAKQWERHHQQCMEATALADQVASSPVDPAWDHACSRLSAEERESIRLQAKCVLVNQRRWWRCVNPWFVWARRAMRR